MRRRRFVALAALAPAYAIAVAGDSAPAIEPGRALEFPRDHGSHPHTAIEWWYATGHIDAAGEPLGFQITFFRVRNPARSKGRFAPRELLFAHAALADRREGRLIHAQAAARAGFADAYAAEADTSLRLGRWQMQRTRASGVYRVELPAVDATQPFAFELALAPTQPLLLQGDRGFSRKGPSLEQASHYYSQPQLAVDGSVTRDGVPRAVRGRAWLDHEWSNAYLDPRASGWDWIGINLDDGGALMAFRIRAREPEAATLWAGATRRDEDGRTRTFEPRDVEFTARRTWTSARTNARYPVACAVRVADETFEIDPLFDDQELDSRASTGLVYWEGASIARRDGRVVGRGYLELTGYAGRLRLPR